MSKWQDDLLRRPRDHSAAGNDESNPRLRDADGQQFAQTRNAMRTELEWVEQTRADAPADLGRESTERRRAVRARIRKKQ